MVRFKAGLTLSSTRILAAVALVLAAGFGTAQEEPAAEFEDLVEVSEVLLDVLPIAGTP